MTPIASFADAAAIALALPDTELSHHYGQPAVKCATNGRAFVGTGGEPDTSFVVLIDVETVDLLMATEPDTYWQTPHYAGHPAVLVRFGAPDPGRVARVIEQAWEQARARKPARKRSK